MARRETFSDEDILAALRAVAGLLGEPLSHGKYDSAEHSGPSSARVIQRFGSWSAACAAAGVRSGAASRTYASKWDRESVIAAVRAFPGSTYAQYEAWAREDSARPSAATVRNVLGGWAAAKAAAGYSDGP